MLKILQERLPQIGTLAGTIAGISISPADWATVLPVGVGFLGLLVALEKAHRERALIAKKNHDLEILKIEGDAVWRTTITDKLNELNTNFGRLRCIDCETPNHPLFRKKPSP